jgi:hypothetical protein
MDGFFEQHTLFLIVFAITIALYLLGVVIEYWLDRRQAVVRAAAAAKMVPKSGLGA